LVVGFGNCLTFFEMKINTLKLSETDSGFDVSHAIIESDHWKPIALLRIHALATKQTKAYGQLLIVGRDHAAFARSDNLVSKETKRGAGTMPTYKPVLLASTHSFRRVFQYKQSMLLG